MSESYAVCTLVASMHYSVIPSSRDTELVCQSSNKVTKASAQSMILLKIWEMPGEYVGEHFALERKFLASG